MYAGAAKRKVLECLDLRADDRARLTSADTATRLHVVPLGTINFRSLATIARFYNKRFDNIGAPCAVPTPPS